MGKSKGRLTVRNDKPSKEKIWLVNPDNIEIYSSLICSPTMAIFLLTEFLLKGGR